MTPPRDKRVLLRTQRDLTNRVSPIAVAERNLIGNNSGNLIFGHAVRRHLATAHTTVEVAPHRMGPKRIARVNAEFDHFVIPLANAFRLGFEPMLDTYSSWIEQLKIPVTVVGVGAQLPTRSNDPAGLEPIRASVTRFVRAVLERSASIGVRGQTTYEYLRSLGFADSEVHVIGCPSLFTYGADLKVEGKRELDRHSKVSLNVSPYRSKMASITTANYQRYPAMRYVPQDLATLRTLLFGRTEAGVEFATGIPYRPSDPLLRERRTDFYIDPTTWIDDLQSRDVSFGTRIHGNIAALLAGTPAIVLAHDSRTRELADYHEIPWHDLEQVPSDVDPARLLEEADFGAFNRNHQQRFDRYVEFLNSNGIDHVFAGDPADAETLADFDRQVRRARYARPVGLTRPMGIVSAHARRGTVAAIRTVRTASFGRN